MSGTRTLWRFPHGGYGEIKGINDAGVETFTSHTVRSFVRESLQNSLDAARSDTVHVEFEEFEVPTTAVPDYVGLRNEIHKCIADGGDKSRTAKRILGRANTSLMDSSIRVMRVSDHNTTGLRGANSRDTGTDWSRLIKESGASGKQDTSGGSYGIGKYASFACSSLRTVFFSSLDDTRYASHIGVSRLISRLEKAPDLYTTGIGYYSSSDKNVAIKGQLDLPGFTPRKRSDFGTDLFVLGFQASGDVTREICRCVLVDFLVALWKGKLTVDVNGKLIDRESLGRHVSDLNAHDKDEQVLETIEHYDLLTSTDPTRKVIPFEPQDLRHPRQANKWGWEPGSCTLYLKKGPDTLNRAVMMTRAAGMKIFNQKSISSSIHFTGILMIEGEAMNRDFKEMEEPSHTKWVPTRATLPNVAKTKYKALRDWIRDMVVASYADTVKDEVEAFGTANLIPRIEPQETGDAQSEEETLSPVISEVKQKDTTPKRDLTNRNTPEQPLPRPGDLAEQVDVTYDNEGDAIRKGEGPAPEGGTEPIRGSEGGDDPGFRPKDEEEERHPLVHVNVRTRLMCTDRAAHTYRLAFVIPHDTSLARVDISVVGEIGSEDLTLTGVEATVEGRRGCQAEGASVTLENVHAGERAEIVFGTTFPHYCMMEADYYETR